MVITPLSIAKNLIGLSEVQGGDENHLIMWMLRLDNDWPQGDEVPWCSAFVNGIAMLAGCPRSKSLRARSWLNIGTPVLMPDLRAGYDIVIFSRPPSPTDGHVAFFDHWDPANPRNVIVVGGNQGDKVSSAAYPIDRIIGCRRLA